MKWDPGSEEAQNLNDLAAAETGRIPPEILDDPEVMVRMPLSSEPSTTNELSPEQLDRLIEMIKEA